MGANAPEGREKMEGVNLCGLVISAPLRARVNPLGGEEPNFYWAEEGAAFNLGGIS